MQVEPETEAGRRKTWAREEKFAVGFEPRELFPWWTGRTATMVARSPLLYDVRSVHKKFLLKPYTFLVFNQICSFYPDFLYKSFRGGTRTIALN